MLVGQVFLLNVQIKDAVRWYSLKILIAEHAEKSWQINDKQSRDKDKER